MKRWQAVAVGSLVAVLLAGLVAWEALRSEPEAAPPVPDATPAPTAEGTPAPAVVPESATAVSEPAACVAPIPDPLPPLAESDAAVAVELAGCVGGLAPTWIAQEDLLRRAAVALSEAVAGRIPRRQLAFMAVAGAFGTVERNGVTYLDPASYRRYTRFVDTVTCVPPAHAATVVTRFEPLLQEALAGLGDAQADIPARVEALLDKILTTPMPAGFVPLARPNVLYEYADPSLEALDKFQKQLLRMGPANLARLQDYARELRAELRRPPPAPSCPPD